MDARFAKTRAALVDALLRLLNTGGFDQLSIREITSAADVGYATFYRHYATKEALLSDVASFEVARLIDVATPIAFVSTMRNSVRATCVHVFERLPLWRALLSGPASGILREEFIRQIVQLKGRADLPIASWLPRELHLTCAAGVTIDVLAWWVAQKPMPPIDTVAEMLDRLATMLTSARD